MECPSAQAICQALILFTFLPTTRTLPDTQTLRGDMPVDFMVIAPPSEICIWLGFPSNVYRYRLTNTARHYQP
jgi:hypothetical protein